MLMIMIIMMMMMLKMMMMLMIMLLQGVPSEEMTVWTDVEAPGAPEIVSLTCQSGSTMFLR